MIMELRLLKVSPSSFSGTLYCYLKVKNNHIVNLKKKIFYQKTK